MASTSNDLEIFQPGCFSNPIDPIPHLRSFVGAFFTKPAFGGLVDLEGCPQTVNHTEQMDSRMRRSYLLTFGVDVRIGSLVCYPENRYSARVFLRISPSMQYELT